MLAIINEIVGKEIKNGLLEFIYVNYLQNEDGSENALKQIMLVYEINDKSHLVIRTPFYSFTEYAKKEFLEKINNNGGK